MRRTLLFLFTLLPWGPVMAVGPEAVYASNGMVTSRSALASQVGVDIMSRGGNAVDAAVAVGFALAVTYPSAGNIGGGGFAVLRLPDNTVVTLDHRETAPASAHRDMFLDEQGNVISGLSTRSHRAAGTPGSVDGLLVLLDRYGTMSRRQVIAPAIRLANDGFELTHDLARQFEQMSSSFAPYPASVAKFSKKGMPYASGERWRQKDLARTLRRISSRGRAGFYEGRTADLIVAEMARNGGDMTHEDLASYRSVWREPVRGSYRGYDIWGMGPPSSGGILIIQILNMLEPYDLKAMGWGSAAVIHHMVEAERRAYADRVEHFGDSDFYPVPVNRLIDKTYAMERFADFDSGRASDSETIGPGEAEKGSAAAVESRETTHFSVMDGSGLMVSFTTTLNGRYGNKIVVPGTGILLNNEMNDFSIKPGTENQWRLIGRTANAIEANKRMLSSMSPTIVTKEGEPVLITGSPGGSTIITTTLQVLVNVIDHEMGIDEAVASPRFHHQWQPNAISYDGYAISPDAREKLEAMGHVNIRRSRWGRGIGDANSILFREGVMHGTKDPRNDGAAIGF